MDILTTYIEQEVKRLGGNKFTLAPWFYIPKANGTVSNDPDSYEIAPKQFIIVTKALYVVKTPSPNVAPGLDNALNIIGSPGVLIQPLAAKVVANDTVDNVTTLEWQGVSPAFSKSIKPVFLCADPLVTASLEGWSITIE